MQLDKLCVACFSPTHTSMKIARAIADGTHIARREEIDLTTDPADTPIAVRNAICIVAAPVYGGLVAPVAVRRIARLRAENSIAIPVVVYGNRDYEDALVQLRDLLYAQGFTPLCGAAFVGEHSYSRPGMPVAEGRPDAADLQKAAAFGAQAYGSLLHQLNLPHPPATDARDFALTYDSPLESLVTAPAMKGNVSYKTLGPSTPQAPVVNGNCYGCGECVDWCPTGAITIADGLVHQMLCLRQVLSRGRTHFRHPLYRHVAPELQCTSRTGMFRLTKCQANLTRIVYPPLYSGEGTKNVGISSRRFYIPQPRARFPLTKRHPLHTAMWHAPRANDIRQPFPVTKSMRIWRTEIRQINQKKPF